MFSRLKTLKLFKLKKTDTRESFQISSQTRINCIHWNTTDTELSLKGVFAKNESGYRLTGAK